MTRDQYDAFVAALLAGEKVDFKDWETNTPYFDGCLPVEGDAERGHETLRFLADEAGRTHIHTTRQ